MSRNGYRLLGYVVWRGTKWYVRRRLPSRRALAGYGLAGLGVAIAGVVLARRAIG
jgi:hypothetical protein